MVDESAERVAKEAWAVVDVVLEIAGGSYPDVIERLRREPSHAAFWSFLGWYRLCGGDKDVGAALREFMSIFEGAAAKMEAPAGGKAGRPTDEGVALARVLKEAGSPRDEICAAVIPNYAGLNAAERRRVWGQLRDRMRNQKKYEQRKSAGRAGAAGAGSGPEPSGTARPRLRPVK